MEGQQFDAWTKALAAGQSRRAILRRLGSGLAGALAVALGSPAAAAPPDHAGKPRGRCPDGFTNCRGTCVILEADLTNCGACAVVCPAGWDCCDGACIDPANDPANCGGCGHPCAAEQACVNGACPCPTGTTDCGGTCVDTQTDPTNCGGCGNACAPMEACSAGTCRVCGFEGGRCCPEGVPCDVGSCTDGICQ